MKYTEVDVLNYVDGRLNDDQTAEFHAALRTDPELASVVEAMQRSQLPIDLAYQQQAVPPVPDALRARIDELISDSKPDQSVPAPSKPKKHLGSAMWMGLTACLIAGVGVGVLLSQFYLQTETISANASVASPKIVTPDNKHDRLVNSIVEYQSLYVENTVAVVSKTHIEDARELLESIRQRGGAKIAVVDYSSYGYEFARAQELGFEGQALVQLVYRKPGSAPLALCYLSGPKTQSKALLVSQQKPLSSASWVANGQHYVLVADENTATLQQMYDHTVNTL